MKNKKRRLWDNNYEKLGFKYRTLSEEEYRRLEVQARASDAPQEALRKLRYIYNTRVFGHSNSGHNFSGGMNQKERKAVIEFLKAVTGPKVQRLIPSS